MTRTEEIVCEIGVCQDCMILHANGDVSPDRPVDLPALWSLLRFGESVTMGGEHNEGCDGTEDCDCGDLGFRQTSRDGCGDWHHGDRYRFTLWRYTRPTLAARARDALAYAHRASLVPSERVRAIEHAAKYRRAILDLYGAA